MVQYVTFTSAEIEFLNNYQPKNEHMTSMDEIEMIGNVFNLDTRDRNERMIIRNSVVKFYVELMDKEIMYDSFGEYAGRTDKYWKYNTAMMSVTAAIDYFRYM